MRKQQVDDYIINEFFKNVKNKNELLEKLKDYEKDSKTFFKKMTLQLKEIKKHNPTREDICKIADDIRSTRKFFHVNNILASELDTYHDVIIIGAGIAGLSAANQLKDEYNVIVLEAKDRIGGRIMTHHSWGGSFDMGASWISGADGNPITELANKYKAHLTPESEDAPSVAYDQDGKKIHHKGVKKFRLVWKQFIDFMFQEQNLVGKEYTLQEIAEDFLDIGAVPKELADLFRYQLAFIETEWAADVNRLSGMFYDRIGYLLPGSQVIFPQGYEKIAYGLADEVGRTNIRTGNIVEKVEYTKEGVRITANVIKQIGYDDIGAKINTRKQIFKGKYVICTVPITVLQRNNMKFSPPLDAKKTESIDKIKLGAFHKTYLLFPKVFWEKDKDWINYTSKEKGRWNTFLNMHRATGKPILLGINSGDYAYELDYKPDYDIKKEAMDVLEKIYKKKTLQPIDIIVSRWHSDPFTKGTYSYTPKNADLCDYDRIAEPSPAPEKDVRMSVEGKIFLKQIQMRKFPRVFFAGEASSKYYPATVHGAYITGIREASRLRYYDTYEKTHNIGKSFPAPGKQWKEKWEVFPEYVICPPGKELIAHKEKRGGKIIYRPFCVLPSEKDRLLKLKPKEWTVTVSSIPWDIALD